jgi:hypothetical protein
MRLPEHASYDPEKTLVNDSKKTKTYGMDSLADCSYRKFGVEAGGRINNK